MPKTILVTRATDVASDSRTQKVVRWLAEDGYQIHCVYWPRGGASPLQPVPNVTFVPAPIPASHGAGLKNIPKLLQWSRFLRQEAQKVKPTLAALHPIDLDTALPLLPLARPTLKLVYDIADFYAHSRLPNGPAPLAAFAQKAEQKVIARANAVLLPAESRIPLLAPATPQELLILANVPADRPPRLPPDPAQPFTILYVGVLSLRRGLAELVQAAAQRPNYRLLIGGTGEDEAAVKNAAANVPNVTFLGKIPYQEVLRLTATAHALPVTYDPTYPNHRFSAPNKLFEGMAAGVPLVVAENTGVDQDVKAHDLGLAIPYADVPALLQALDHLANQTPEQRTHFKTRAQSLFESQFSPEIMRDRLLRLYHRIVGPP